MEENDKRFYTNLKSSWLFTNMDSFVGRDEPNALLDIGSNLVKILTSDAARFASAVPFFDRSPTQIVNL